MSASKQVLNRAMQPRPLAVPTPRPRMPVWGAAKAETLKERASFREAFQRRRCVVRADAFYEWVRGPGGTRQPLWIHPRAGRLMLCAGLYESWYPAPSVYNCDLDGQ
jgi:putative SOS response-associated peptidase YedK